MSGLAIYVKPRGGRLVPASEADEEAVRALPPGKVVKATVVRERNAPQNAFYWALCAKIAAILNDMGEADATKDNVSDRIKIATGHCSLSLLSPHAQRETGQKYAVTPKSIAFHKMDQAEFNAFLNRATAFILIELLQHFPTGEFRQMINQMLTEVSA